MKKAVVAIILVFAFLSFASASINTQVTVNTYPSVSVQLSVVNPDTLDSIKSFLNDTDSNGNLVLNFDASNSRVFFAIIVRKEGRIVQNIKTDNYSLGGNINLNLLQPVETPAPVVNNTPTEPVANDTAAVAEDSVKNQTENNAASSLTGNAVNVQESTGKKSYISYILYILIAAALVVGLFFLTVFVKNKRQSKGFAVPPKPSVQNFYSSGSEGQQSGAADSELVEAERKIKEAQAEIDNIKNRKTRVYEAEAKFKAAQEELDRVRRESL